MTGFRILLIALFATLIVYTDVVIGPGGCGNSGAPFFLRNADFCSIFVLAYDPVEFSGSPAS